MKGSDRTGNRVNPDHTALELGLFLRNRNKQTICFRKSRDFNVDALFVVSDSPGSDCLLG